MPDVTPYIFKKIPVQFFGKKSTLNTSQELFCCNEVDAGSTLLISSVMKELPLPQRARIADIGCGTGVLSLALHGNYPDSRILAVDRDALALAFTEMNCRENGFDVETRSSLGAADIFDETFDLVLSNIPAKAGLPAIRTMLADFSRLAAPAGTVAVVVVRTLSDFAEGVIREAGGTILFRNKTREYTVFHYRNMSHDGVNQHLSPYIRSSVSFDAGSNPLMLDTVWGIGEFDSLSYTTRLVLQMLDKHAACGSTLVVNPGQGYVPVALSSPDFHQVSSLHVACRDYLSLCITEKNVQACTGKPVTAHHCSLLGEVEGIYDTVVVLYEKEAVPTAHELLLESLASLTAPGAMVIIAGSSTSMHRFDLGAGTIFSRIADKKNRGFRVLVLKRK